MYVFGPATMPSLAQPARGEEPVSQHNPLTTGQAAEYCHVSQATIVNWIKKKKLKAYATPGGHYRITLSDFLSFLEAHDMPVDAKLRAAAQPQILVVSERARARRLAQAAGENGHAEVALARNGHEAGAQVALLEPDVVIIDTNSGTLDWQALCRWLRASPVGKMRVVAVGDPAHQKDAEAAGVDAFLPNPLSSAQLGKQLMELLE